jgi:raffinose/stachyose/melibiose transport system substrate-binding protein
VIVRISGEPGVASAYDTIAERFNASHPDTLITVVKNSSDIFNPVLVPALSAGEGPDLFHLRNGS